MISNTKFFQNTRNEQQKILCANHNGVNTENIGFKITFSRDIFNWLIKVLRNGCFHNAPVIYPRSVIMASDVCNGPRRCLGPLQTSLAFITYLGHMTRPLWKHPSNTIITKYLLRYYEMIKALLRRNYHVITRSYNPTWKTPLFLVCFCSFFSQHFTDKAVTSSSFQTFTPNLNLSIYRHQQDLLQGDAVGFYPFSELLPFKMAVCKMPTTCSF